MRSSVLVAVVAMLAVACGAYAMPGSSPTPRGGIDYDMTATETVHQVSVHVGQRLEVVLHAAGGMGNWSHPTSSDRSVLSPIVDPAATAARGVTLAAFEAMRQGEAEVSATASPLCSPGRACPMLVAVYSLRVTITP